MKFKKALKVLEDGGLVRRSDWNIGHLSMELDMVRFGTDEMNFQLSYTFDYEDTQSEWIEVEA